VRRVLSVGFWLFFGVTAVVFMAGVTLVWLATGAFDRRLVVLQVYAAAWGRFYIWVNPMWSLRIRGRDRLPWRGAAILVANHASIIDILAVQALSRPFKWVSKAGDLRDAARAAISAAPAAPVDVSSMRRR
jgi:1-acyl-sn-glycerol-3-phosphate acyltransferase